MVCPRCSSESVTNDGRTQLGGQRFRCGGPGRRFTRRSSSGVSVRAFAHGETSVNEVIEIEAFDGVRKIVQTSAVPIRDTNERITGAVVVNEDISARKTAERELNDSYNQMRTLTGRGLFELDFDQNGQMVFKLSTDAGRAQLANLSARS